MRRLRIPDLARNPISWAGATVAITAAGAKASGPVVNLGDPSHRRIAAVVFVLTVRHGQLRGTWQDIVIVERIL